MARRRLQREEYTVGWVCALPIELAAAQEMLDEEHEGLEQDEHDNNLYSLGCIGEHNVVIVCLPAGLIGNNPAAAVAMQMRSTFRSMRFGLMVGIGGGVPSVEADIRLGDVVVSQPHQGCGGVIQYDFGKATPSGFQRTGFLNSPPVILLSAVAKVRANHVRGRSQLSEYVSKLRRLPKFRREAAGPDVLFEAMYNHEGAVTCQPCRLDKQVDREPRESEEAAVHYGTIASGNRVMRDAAVRDSVSAEFGGVLCFEMEAAGLMNSFPCLIIRGICDYADSHKNKKWQEYAAGTAAAYAKEVLSVMPRAKVAKSLTVDEITKKTSACHRIPFSRNRRFVGRSTELKKLTQKTLVNKECQRLALVGLGGVGKTQVALEFAYLVKETRPDYSIFWMPAVSTESFEQAGADIARELRLPQAAEDNDMKEDVKERVRQHLSSQRAGRWLLILDNADDPEVLFGSRSKQSKDVVDQAPQSGVANHTTDVVKRVVYRLPIFFDNAKGVVDYLPQSDDGFIVFTTRYQKTAVELAGNNVIELEAMSQQEAASFLEKSLIREELLCNDSIKIELLEELTYLPLAIAQAAAYLNANKIPVSEYLRLLRNTEEDIISLISREFRDGTRYRSSKNAVATTWLVSFDQILEQDEAAADLLSFMSCIEPRAIPRSILPPVQPEERMVHAIGTLCAYAFVVRQESGELYDLHRLVHLATKIWVRHHGLAAKKMENAVRHLARIYPSDGYRNHALSSEYLPHALKVLQATQRWDLTERDNLCLKVGRCLLNRLPYAVDAPSNSYSRQYKPTCIPNTRIDALHEIDEWADQQDKRCIFWLNGLAGTGKSTIARTVAGKYHAQNRLGASFLFSKGGGDVDQASKFITSIVIQLAKHVPPLEQHLCEALTEHSDIASRSLHEQWHHLVLSPLSKLDGSDYHSSYILVVDALDECEDKKNIQIVLQLLAEARSLKRVQLRVFLTSRPEIPIRYWFRQIPDAEHQDFALHDISRSIVDHDIYIFLEHNLSLIKQEHSLDAAWPGEVAVRSLVQMASGLFIWAATACRFIREGERFAVQRLDTILKGSGNAVTAPEQHLNEIYTTVLRHSVSPKYTDTEKKELYYMLRQILGSIVILFSPLSAYSLSRLLQITQNEVDQTLKDLHSILYVPKNQTLPLRLHHPSFRDFLLSSDRCKDPIFWVDEKQASQILADSCISVMRISLRQDIYGLDAPGVIVTDIERSRVEQYLPQEIQYACLYWVEHLQKSGTQFQDNDPVHQFLQEHFLHWLEALGWMWKVSEGIHAIASLESIISTHEFPRLSEYVHDIKRFTLYSRPAIEQAPLQTYCSALVFAPIRRPPKVEKNWNALLQTLNGHSSLINAVAFSSDSKTRASASTDSTVKLWDAGLGAELQALWGHSRSVNVVAFSPDGKLLASASEDRTVKLWDTGSGAVLQTLWGHSRSVNAVAFSPDGKQLASASNDNTVKLWDARSGKLLQTLEGHSNWVRAVAFSPDGKLLASVSEDRMVKLWDAGSRAMLQTLEGHSSSITAVALSPDGKLLASASGDKTVKLWDARSGAELQTLDVGAVVLTLSFSDDGTCLQTDRGLLQTTCYSSGAPVSRPTLPPSVSVKEQWVSRGTQNILWLPPEHRPSSVAVHGGIIGFGYRSGRVSFMEFAF